MPTYEVTSGYRPPSYNYLEPPEESWRDWCIVVDAANSQEARWAAFRKFEWQRCGEHPLKGFTATRVETKHDWNQLVKYGELDANDIIYADGSPVVPNR